MIENWLIESDTIQEQARPTGETVINAEVQAIEGEAPEDTVARAKLECYRYRDPAGYSCQRNIPHPLNNERLGLQNAPIFQESYTVEEHPENARMCKVTLTWRTPEEMEGGIDLRRVPPEHGQWSERRPCFRDPNTKKWFLTTAGELITGVEDDATFETLSYTLRLPREPRWYREAVGKPINSDTVILDGRPHRPETLLVQQTRMTPIENGRDWWREIHLELAINPDGWHDLVPNAGLYEQHLLFRKKGEDGKPGEMLEDMNIYLSESELQLASRVADRDISIVITVPSNGATPFTDSYFVYRHYRRIKDQLFPSFGDDAHDPTNVVEPVAINPTGQAYRTRKTIDQPYGHEVMSVREITPQELIVLKLTKKRKVRFSQFGLW